MGWGWEWEGRGGGRLVRCYFPHVPGLVLRAFPELPQHPTPDTPPSRGAQGPCTHTLTTEQTKEFCMQATAQPTHIGPGRRPSKFS